MSPFIVRWALKSPMVVPLVPIHLDALLSWARVRVAEMEGNEEPWSLQHDLPLARHETSQGWCFKASWLQLDANDDDVVHPMHIVRRSNVTDWAEAWESGLLGRKVPAYDPARGNTKGASLQHQKRHYHQATAYGIGDIEKVRVLLGHVESLGKLHRRGAGWIDSFTVEPDQSAEALWKRRHLPATEILPGYAKDVGALSAPYWKRAGHCEVLVPIG